MPERIRELACPRCHAPLDWKPGSRVVICEYCRTSVMVDAPAPAPPPEQPRPVPRRPAPAPAPAPTSRPVILAVALVGLLVILGAVGSFVARGGAAQGSRLEVKALASVELESSPAALSKKLGAKVFNHSVYAELDHTDFDRVTFSWREGETAHATHVGLSLRRDHQMPAAVMARAREQFGHHLAASGQLSGPGVVFIVGDDYVNIAAHRIDDAKHKERLAALYRAQLYVAFGLGEPMAAADQQRLLNIRQPIEGLAEVPPDTPLEKAHAAVREHFPGAEQDGASFQVGFEHPTFVRGRVGWENEPGGKLSGVTFYFPNEFDFAKHRPGLVSCLERALGKAEKQVMDYAKGESTERFVQQGGRPEVMFAGNTIGIYRRDKVTAAGWREAIEALSGCGR